MFPVGLKSVAFLAENSGFVRAQCARKALTVGTAVELWKLRIGIQRV